MGISRPKQDKRASPSNSAYLNYPGHHLSPSTDNFAKKGYFRFKAEKVNIIMEF